MSTTADDATKKLVEAAKAVARRASVALSASPEAFSAFSKDNTRTGRCTLATEDVKLILKRKVAKGPVKFVMKLMIPSSEKLDSILDKFSYCIESRQKVQENTEVVIEFSKHSQRHTARAMQALHTIVSPVKTGGYEQYWPILETEKEFSRTLEEIFTISADKPFRPRAVRKLDGIIAKLLYETGKSQIYNDFHCLIAEKLFLIASQTSELRLLDYVEEYFDKVFKTEDDKIYFSYAQAQLGKIALLKLSEDVENFKLKHFDVAFFAEMKDPKDLQEMAANIIQIVLKKEKAQAKMVLDVFPDELFDAFKHFAQSDSLEAECFRKELLRQYLALKHIKCSLNEGAHQDLQKVCLEKGKKGFEEHIAELKNPNISRSHNRKQSDAAAQKPASPPLSPKPPAPPSVPPRKSSITSVATNPAIPDAPPMIFTPPPAPVAGPPKSPPSQRLPAPSVLPPRPPARPPSNGHNGSVVRRAPAPPPTRR